MMIEEPTALATIFCGNEKLYKNCNRIADKVENIIEETIGNYKSCP